MSRIGLYFGSFNPVHIGHLAIAGYFAEFTDLEQIWFVVSPQNPLKKKETLLDDYERLRMVDLALGDSFKLRSCDVEFRMPVPSYTIDTMAYLEELHPDHDFCLIMGGDNIRTLYKWKNVDLLVRKYPIYVYPRRESLKEPTLRSKEIEDRAEIRNSVRLLLKSRDPLLEKELKQEEICRGSFPYCVEIY